MATINDFGIPGLDQSGILHPKHKNRWRVTFAGLGGGTDARPVSLQAIQVSRPNVTVDEIELHRYNGVAYVAGKYRFDPMNLTIEDDITSLATQAINAQFQKQQWLIGSEGPWLAAASEGSLYKFTTILDMLDGNQQTIESFIYQGCWIQSLDFTDLDYQTADAVQITMQIRYDMVRQDVREYSEAGSALGGSPSRG